VLLKARAKKMAGGVPIPANHAILLHRESVCCVP
jgi:hypothetical protein